MRKLGITTVLTFMFSVSMTFAQNMEIKVNPLALASTDFKASAEFIQGSNIGLEANVGYNNDNRMFNLESYQGNGFEVGGQAKYYFKPKTEADKFYLGVYSNYVRMSYQLTDTEQNSFTNNKINAGFSLGYKWVTAKGFVFEIGSGLGRAFVNDTNAVEGSAVDVSTINIGDFHVPGRLSIGLRF